MLPSSLVKQLGCPYLPFPTDGWPDCKHKVLIVGQVPLEWGFENGKWGFEGGNPPVPWPHDPLRSLKDALDYGRRCGVDRAVEALTAGYILSCDDPTGAQTPFNRAFNFFKRALKHEGSDGIISTNFLRCALYSQDAPKERLSLLGASLEKKRQVLDWQRGCLTKEIEALAPTGLVFLTGPDYDKLLADEFPGIEFKPVDDHASREFARVSHRSLPPATSFRTYHAKNLSLGKHWSWLNEIASAVID